MAEVMLVASALFFCKIFIKFFALVHGTDQNTISGRHKKAGDICCDGRIWENDPLSLHFVQTLDFIAFKDLFFEKITCQNPCCGVK